MKGKAKNKRKIGKVILIGMGFFLTIILTFTTTLAWFYDSDWASKYVQMGGSVGIKIKDSDDNFTSGAGNLHFNIQPADSLAYPGQAVDVSASCYNDGGRSGNPGGSDCYVRAHFAVYTNIGLAPNPNDYVTAEYPDGTLNPAYQEDLAEYNAHQEENESLSAEALYAFLNSLITSQNANSATTHYYWKYYKRTGALPLSDSGTQTSDVKYYLDGSTYETAAEAATSTDKGYFYLCDESGSKLKSLGVGDDATFLWNSTFIIPWQLTNVSAGKYIFVGLTFQAIQTFIPNIDSNGVISGAANNQLNPDSCTYNNDAVQTVFNSCSFTPINTTISIGGNPINFAGTGFTSCDSPQTP